MIRLIIWTAAMTYVGFLFAGKGSYLPLALTVSGALMGAGGGSILAFMFTSRALRKQRSMSGIKRY